MPYYALLSGYSLPKHICTLFFVPSVHGYTYIVPSQNTCSCGHTMHFTYRKWFNLGKLTSNHQGKSYLGLSISPGEKRMKDQTGEVNMWGCPKFSSYFPATSNATDFNKWGFLDGFNREVIKLFPRGNLPRAKSVTLTKFGFPRETVYTSSFPWAKLCSVATANIFYECHSQFSLYDGCSTFNFLYEECHSYIIKILWLTSINIYVNAEQ